MVETQIRVRGLRELIRDLRALDDGVLGREVREVNLSFARRIVPLVQSRFTAFYPTISGQGVGSIRATAGVDRASVQFATPGMYSGLNGWKVPFGMEFGSFRRRQFFPWTGPSPSGAGSAGRFLYPVLREEVPDLMDEYVDAIDQVLSRAFPAAAL